MKAPGCHGIYHSMARMDGTHRAVLRPERARQETDPARNDAAHVPHAELVRSLGRGNRGCHLRQLRHEALPED